MSSRHRHVVVSRWLGLNVPTWTIVERLLVVHLALWTILHQVEIVTLLSLEVVLVVGTPSVLVSSWPILLVVAEVSLIVKFTLSHLSLIIESSIHVHVSVVEPSISVVIPLLLIIIIPIHLWCIVFRMHDEIFHVINTDILHLVRFISCPIKRKIISLSIHRFLLKYFFSALHWRNKVFSGLHWQRNYCEVVFGYINWKGGL